jgi:crossover junction endodeoxyribonuclease RuvC
LSPARRLALTTGRTNDKRPTASNPLIVLGIDPGLTVTGWGAVEARSSHYRWLGCGAIATTAKQPVEQRLHKIYGQLCEVISRWQPGEVAVEDPFVAQNARSAFAIGEARAVALLAAAQAGLAVRAYAPAEVKLTIAGYGRSDKTQVQEMVRLQLGLAQAPEPADAADALAVALCHHLRRQAELRVGAVR